MRILEKEMKKTFYDILRSRKVEELNASLAARNFTETSLDGVYSHGVNRFPRIVDYLDRGLVDGNAKPIVLEKKGSLEQWDGKGGLGNVNAKMAMDRACDLAKNAGIGLVAIGNTNHWLRGGAYGWQAADRGCIGICWTNTMPNMPAWGGTEPRIGNNPFIIGIPKNDGQHVVMDCAMSQFAYGKIEMARIQGKQLPVPGGWDTDGNITTDPVEIEKTQRVLPIGYWKGSGLSIVLDLVAAILSGGNTVTDIGQKHQDEICLSQVMVAMDATAFAASQWADDVIQKVVSDIKTATPVASNERVYYPGELEWLTRQENKKNGIPVLEEIWESIENLRR